MVRKLALGLLISFPLLCYSESSVSISFKYEEGVATKIIVEGKSDNKMWVSVSLYPADYKDAVKEGRHIVRKLKAGTFIEVIILDSLHNASYEVALWNKKVECQEDWCKERGYYLDEVAFYQTGYFNSVKAK